ncbi:MAG: sulfatase [bacterium]|nr:sulfatase [bacterium]
MTRSSQRSSSRNIRPLPASRGLRLLALAGFAVLSPACSGPTTVEMPSQPHPIIVLAVDGLRADHLGCYGYDRDTSPHLNALAQESVRFEWAFAQAPTAAPSLASILTGLYPTTHALVDEGDRLRGEALTLAEALAAHGLVTAAFVDGVAVDADRGFAQKFAHFFNGDGAGLEEIGPRAIRWLEEHAAENFLLLIHASDLTAPYAPAAEYRELFLAGREPPSEGFEASVEQLEAVRSSLQGETPQPLPASDLEYAKALYDAEIRAVDAWIGRFLETFRELGLDQRATLAVLATHGQEFQEHSSVLEGKLYTTVTRVPLMIRLPHAQKARSLGKIVETVDLMPTLLDLAGAEVATEIQGASLVPLILDAGKPPYIAFGESPQFGERRFVALGGYRMLLSRETDAAELYNLLEDPVELHELSAAEANRVVVLREHLEAWEMMVAAASLDPEKRTEQPLDDDTLERLKSLGYIQ